VHVPLVRQVPGLAAFTGGRCAALDRSEPAYYFVATLDFATEADYRTGLSSPEMGKAVGGHHRLDRTRLVGGHCHGAP
jgi:uncharacterized protein (TIGR02118 family)